MELWASYIHADPILVTYKVVITTGFRALMQDSDYILCGGTL